MHSFDKALAWVSFTLVACVVLFCPWLFGAWEAWFFWPAATLLFVSGFAFSIRLFLKAYRAEMFNRTGWQSASTASHTTALGFLLYGLFLLYAFIRLLTSEVYADAERSFLLFVTPAVIGVQVVFGFSSRQNRLLFTGIACNLALLGIYGIVNHLLFKNTHTMWLPGEPQYQIGFFRATGSYVCPDHFSGIMELALGIGIAFAFTRRAPKALIAGGLVLCAIALAGVFFSKSRGGGLTVLVVSPVALAICLFTWTSSARLYLRAASVLAMAALLTALLASGNAYMQRFSGYFSFSGAKGQSRAEALEHIKQRLRSDARGIMYSAAYRAWKTAPVFGIGPGMHQNLWPHFAASPDGNRATADWPTQINNQWYSYEVHNDWLQLLEEYGAVGLALFLPPFISLAAALGLLRREAARTAPPCFDSVSLISAMLALTAMSFHSLGDFNLQIPATTWMLAVLLCIPLHLAANSRRTA